MVRTKVKKIVVDSSVIVKWLNTQDENDLLQADRLLDDWEKGKLEIIAPELAKYEVGNALLYKDLNTPAFKASLAAFYALPISYIYQTEIAAKEAGVIAREERITFYDATFLQTAQSLGAFLVTANQKHQKSWKSVRVIPLTDY